jgi:hypothetical protein
MAARTQVDQEKLDRQHLLWTPTHVDLDRPIVGLQTNDVLQIIATERKTTTAKRGGVNQVGTSVEETMVLEKRLSVVIISTKAGQIHASIATEREWTTLLGDLLGEKNRLQRNMDVLVHLHVTMNVVTRAIRTVLCHLAKSLTIVVDSTREIEAMEIVGSMIATTGAIVGRYCQVKRSSH